MWVLLAIISSLFLGAYDLFKKHALKDNAVVPTLFFATLTEAIILIIVWLLNKIGLTTGTIFAVPPASLDGHLFIVVKSIIVGSSWILAYFAFKHLPVTIATPIRSTGPIWTLLGAMFLFSEKLNFQQWVGILTTILFLYVFSLAGKKEGIVFRSNQWIFFMFIATLIGAVSGLYDKFLMQRFHPLTVQVWFSVYLTIIFFLILLVLWYPQRQQHTPFRWRMSIAMIGITLTIADFVYFLALTEKGSLIAIVSVIRRSSIIYSFSLAAIILKEGNVKRKGLALAGILAGVIIIALAKLHPH